MTEDHDEKMNALLRALPPIVPNRDTSVQVRAAALGELTRANATPGFLMPFTRILWPLLIGGGAAWYLAWALAQATVFRS
jgi:hypothetical protein